MAKLTDKERETLLEVTQKVHAYKVMQARGYENLIKKATDEILESTTLQDLVDRQYEKGPFQVKCISNEKKK